MKSLIQGQFFYLKYRKLLGLSWVNFTKLNRFSKDRKGNFRSFFFGHPIKYPSPFWFLHSIKEIFIDEVYKLSNNTLPIKIIDCGANIGLSVLYTKLKNKDAHIIAIEPDPNIFKLLEENVKVYNFNNIQLINAAVWKEETFLSFEAEGSVGGKLSSDPKQNLIEIPTVRLRNLLAEKIDFLKIDIEGAEYEVLKDCKDLLGNVDNLFIEYHCLQGEVETLDEILQWVREAGFRYYIKEAWNNMSFPFTKKYNDFYHMQLNIFCFRN